jgi:phospholipid/cholesterol/gamma-HCH transport system substrate-binding protein
MNKGRGGLAPHIITILLFTGLFVVWVGYILEKSGTLPTLGKKYDVTAVVPTAQLLTPGARVTIAGAQVGKVKSIERASDIGPDAKIKLELTDDRVFPLPNDSRVQVRTRSQVGENYVSITVGNSKHTLPSGGELGLDNADDVVSVDQILSVIQGKTKERTRVLLQQFGGALTGRGTDLNHTISGVNNFAVGAGSLVGSLYDNHQATADIVDHLGRLMSAVGDRGTAIDTIASRGYTAFRAIGDRDAQLEATLRELPSTLDAVKRASATVGRVSDSSAPVVDNLATSVRDLKPAVEAFTPASQEGVKLVRTLASTRENIGGALQAVARLGYHLPAVYPELTKTLCQINPMLRYANPYSKDILQVIYGLGSSSNAYDATGHTIRLIPTVGGGSLFGAPPAVLQAARTLTDSGAFLKAKSSGYDAYPGPGIIGKIKAVPGSPQTPEELKASGRKFTHVTADC